MTPRRLRLIDFAVTILFFFSLAGFAISAVVLVGLLIRGVLL